MTDKIDTYNWYIDPGCHLLGDYYETVSNDVAKAFQIYKKNCEENHFMKSCNKAGKLLFQVRVCDCQDLVIGRDPISALIGHGLL